MDMNINSKVIKTLRKQKLWSQEDLAAACGVSLRTIQRLEGEGQASPETVKALASVFEIDVMQVMQQYDDTRGYLNIQLGYPILFALIVSAALMTWYFSTEEMSLNAFAVSITLQILLCSLFCSLTTRTLEDCFQWYFGVGLIRKSVAYSSIKSVRKVRNKAWWGWGIRLVPSGWLYCVSGLNAIELILDNGKAVRVGTDEPDELLQAIEQARMR